MRTIGFIGGYDKTEFLLQIARVLTLANKKVIMIDATELQKTRYIVPTMSLTKSYITEFEDFDVAVGFDSIEKLESFADNLNYDIALLDIDTKETAKSFKIEENYKNCFVTGFDLYSLRRGMEVLNSLENPVKLTKVLFSKNFSKAENSYLDYLSKDLEVEWDEETFHFIIDPGSYSVMIENQTISRIKIKKLSTAYKSTLMYFISNVFSEDLSAQEAKKIFKTMERV